MIIIAGALLYIPSVFSTGATMFGDDTQPQTTAPITTPVGDGQVTIQLL